MATIINNPQDTRTSDDAGVGLIVGALIAIALLVLFFVYGLPALRNQNNAAQTTQPGTNINVTLPGSASQPSTPSSKQGY